jgi:hypothetical protein
MPQDDYEPQPIDPGSLPANTYAHGISYPVHESMAADSAPADGLSDENLSSDVPSLSITLSGIDDFTAFESYSQSVLAQFSETMASSGGVQTPPGFLGAVGAIANASIVDVTINQMYTPGGILPAVSITDFYVLVNGILRGVTSAVRRGASDYYDLRTVRLTLSSPVRFGDIVEVTYINTVSAGSVTDTAGPANYLSSFYLLNALNMTPGYSYSLLEILGGLSDEPFGPDAASINIDARLLEYRRGFPYTTVLLDTVAPYGQVIINEDAASGGIKVHLFEAVDSGGDAIAGTNYLENISGRPVRKSGELAGVDDESLYEIIGTGNIHAISKSLPKTESEYPEVKGVKYCCVSTVPKAVLIDARMKPTDQWSPVFYGIANDITKEYYTVNFANAVKTAGVRIRHGGNVYAATGSGELTFAAYDDVSHVSKAQISHFSDFRDAADFSTAGADGWFDYTDGVSLVDWELVNVNRLWMHQRGKLSSSIKFVTSIGSTLIAFTTTQAYTWSSTGGMSLSQTFGGNIQAVTTHRDDVYIGLSDGRVYRTSNGSSYTHINPSTSLPGITALQSFGGVLWIGTSRDGDDISYVYSYDGTSTTNAKSFSGKYVGCMTSTSKYLFVGLSDDTNTSGGVIYLYDGIAWTPSRDTSTDRVDAMGYGAGVLWAGMSGGIIHTLSFDNTGTATQWDIPPQTSDAEQYYQIKASSDGNFVWFVTDIGLQVYYVPEQTYSSIEGPAIYSDGVTAVYTESDVSNYKDTQYLPGGLEQATVTEYVVDQDDILTYAAALTPSINTTYQNACWTGYMRADFTDTYTIYADGAEGFRVYIGGELDGDDWTGGELLIDNWDTPSLGEKSATYELIAGQMVPIRVEAYRSTGDFDIHFKWASTNITKTTVPAENLFLDNVVDSRATLYDVCEFSNAYIYAGIDGRLHSLDTSPISSRVRRVYARFQDVAGNITASTVLTNDFILEDTERRGDEIVSSGKIYQVTTDKQIVATFTPQQNGALYAPDRRLRISGRYESVPFYVAALTRWDMISFAATLSAGTEQAAGLEQGVEVNLYVRTGDTRNELLAADWGEAYTRSTIPPETDSGYVDTALVDEFNLEPIEHKKWLQFKLELITAQQNVSPVVHAVTLSYLEADASYFFTTMFDTSNYSATVPAPEFRRGILTANSLPNGGIIKYGYTTSDEEGATFDFAQYEEITPNRIFALPTTSSKIRFGIMIVSIDSVNPAVVDEFGVILDAGDEDMNFM